MSKFRILGIRLYKTKWCSVNKVLKEGWFPFGNYPEPREGEPYSLPVRTKTVEQLYDLYNSLPHIEVSCLVGMNGAGKSTLLDVLYRIINNYAVTVLGSKMDNKHGRYLRYAKGLNADLYYELEDKVLKIECRDEKVELYEQDVRGLFRKQAFTIGDYSAFDYFFYTISNNYSLYSLNEKEYNETITVEKRGKKIESCINGDWIEGLFHKNDGYLSPIVITPYREAGSISIEKENRLALQRIAAIAVLGAAKKEPSILDGYRVKSIKYRLDRDYKFKVDAKYYERWQHSIDNKECFDRIISTFKDEWGKKLGARLDKHQEPEKEPYSLWGGTRRKDLILEYLAYKSFRICDTYDDYYVLFDMDGLLKSVKDPYIHIKGNFGWLQRNKQRFKDVIDRLCDSQYDSHINLKIRQCLEYTDNVAYNGEEGEIELNVLVKGKEVKTFDDAVLLLPPAFYDIDLVLESEKGENTEEKKSVAVSTLSSGERQMLYTMSYVLYHLKNIQSVKSSENCHKYNYINLVFDEAELYYHPDYQKLFVKNLIDYIHRCHLDNSIIKSINIIIATHSPFVLTDILTQNTLYLDNGHRKIVDNQTFGANYYDMLHDSFFFNDTALGGVATHRIKEWISRKNEKGTFMEALSVDEVQSLIGDPLIANYLLSGFYV